MRVTRRLIVAIILCASPTAALAGTDPGVRIAAAARGHQARTMGGRRTVVAVPLPAAESITLDGRLDEPF
jgi:hypothetical protein